MSQVFCGFPTFTEEILNGKLHFLRSGSLELHKKFAPIFKVCQRRRYSEKTKTGITFDLDLILTYGLF